MTLGHEKLDVYRLSIEYVAWVYEIARGSVLECASHGRAGIDFDPDSDFDLDAKEFQQKKLNRTVVSLALHHRRLVESMGSDGSRNRKGRQMNISVQCCRWSRELCNTVNGYKNRKEAV